MENILHINFPEVTEVVRDRIQKATGLAFLSPGAKGGNLCYVNSPELREEFRTVFREEDAGYYLYGLLHSSESLKSGRDLTSLGRDEVISPASENMFWKMSGLGEELWRVHVNWERVVFGSGYSSEGDGDCRVEEVLFRKLTSDGGAGESDRVGRIYLNERCSIRDVPEFVWNFYLRSDYPAQVWVTDRLGSTLSQVELSIYLHLLSAVERTASLVKMVDATLANFGFSK
jgi:predicted helicase